MSADLFWNRRRFIATVASASGLAALPKIATSSDDNWDAGLLAHLIPAANHNRFAIKASFTQAIEGQLTLTVGGKAVLGHPTDTAGHFFSFDIGGLEPDVEYPLQILSKHGTPLCDPWPLRTFPHPNSKPEHVRLLAYTCAGGHPDDGKWSLPTHVKRLLLRRALSFNPHAVIAIGDHIYWDQRTEHESPDEDYASRVRAFHESIGWLDKSLPALGTKNEISLKAAVDPQISQLYGTLLRSIPSYFVSDDHDYFENDNANSRMVTFPPDHYQLEFARFTRNAYLPEFLPDGERPLAIPGTGAGDRAPDISEAFGTFRYGRLAEAVIYDCARFLSLKGSSAGLIPPEAEKWLLQRTYDQRIAQLIHVPSHPFGWSAGKWREWYPDVAATTEASDKALSNCFYCDSGGQVVGLTTDQEKYLWQSGWWNQHQRLLDGLTSQKHRNGIVLSGDLHAIGHASLERSGDLNLSKNPVHSILTGTLGTGEDGWPSDARGTPPLPATGLFHKTRGDVLEKNGFTLLDITPSDVTVRLFAWKSGESLNAIDSLEPYHTYTIT